MEPRKEPLKLRISHPFPAQVAAADDGTARGREARQRCWAEVKHLPLIPLEDGSVAACRPRRRVFDGPTTTTGAPLLATPRQSALCPGLARRVVRLRAAKAAPALFDGGPLSLEFATAVGLERFTLATLAAELDAPWGDRLPADRRRFVAEFWREAVREVDFEDPHAVALFGDLPLIPLEGGGALACRHRDAVVAEPSDLRADDAALERELAALARAADAARREAAADEAAALARYLAALPPNVLTPGAFREALRRVAEAEGFAYDELDVDGLEAAGCGAFLSVVRGSPRRDAALVRLSKGPASARPLVLVGKGVTFDTGGYNVKGASGMKGMKGDMAGAAAAVGAAVALSRLGVGGEASPLPLEVWLCVADNLISPDAFYPDEVVTACDGTTVEIVHTDAEGRMVLADALALASRKVEGEFAGATKPALLVDLATLTGSAIGAVSKNYGAAFTNDATPATNAALVAAGAASGERLWPMPPLDAHFRRELESDVADTLQCLESGQADHIYAASFLERFVADDVPWIHLDLAAASTSKGLAHVRTGPATGFGVRAVVGLVLDHWDEIARS
ncbi:manganese ion binding protein [Aureococcus anophagefferens]|uniref:Manganese ion binding protein n=2 Tax=Aureococcus anophagefferens TaxID=44056 RepID=A0ABR1G6A7_AURAN